MWYLGMRCAHIAHTSLPEALSETKDSNRLGSELTGGVAVLEAY